MSEEGEGEKRKGPSIKPPSMGTVISLIGLLASGVASYYDVKSDIAALKRGEVYQERMNERLLNEIKDIRVEIRETMNGFNDKLDRIIYHWSGKK